jgi:hypothetical protein
MRLVASARQGTGRVPTRVRNHCRIVANKRAQHSLSRRGRYGRRRCAVPRRREIWRRPGGSAIVMTSRRNSGARLTPEFHERPTPQQHVVGGVAATSRQRRA